MKLQLGNPGSSRDLGNLPVGTMSDDDSSESVVPTTRGVAPPPARQEDLKVLRTGLIGARSTRTDSSFGSRLKRTCERIGTQGDAAYVAGLSIAQLKNYLTGKSEPSLRPIAALAQAANVNLLWLATGDGPMTGAPVPATTPEPKRDTVQDEPEALEIGRAVLTLVRAIKTT